MVLDLYEPGRRARPLGQLADGMVSIGPDEYSANGTLVFDINDIMLRLGPLRARRVKMQVRDGAIALNRHGGLDALQLGKTDSRRS